MLEKHDASLGEKKTESLLLQPNGEIWIGTFAPQAYKEIFNEAGPEEKWIGLVDLRIPNVRTSCP